MGKGGRRERECRKIYERAGYWVYAPENAMYGDNDLWNLFDLACFNPKYGVLRLVQVKSNGARGITKWIKKARKFTEIGNVTVEYAIPYDNEGWRLARNNNEGSYTNVYDERTEHDGNMGDGLAQFLQDELTDVDDVEMGTEADVFADVKV